jgi:hypothetical protein
MNRYPSLLVALAVLLGTAVASAGEVCFQSSGPISYGPAHAYPVLRAPEPSTYSHAPHQIFHSPVQVAVVPRPHIAVATGVSVPSSMQAQSQTQASRRTAVTMSEQVTAAMEAFQLGNNHEAFLITDRLIDGLPTSSDLLQFRSLIHLRAGNFKKSAADVYEGVRLGAIWTTDQVDKVYGDKQRYRDDVRVLGLLAASNPEALETQFLLAYHQMVAGDLAASRISLKQMLAVRPDEPLATALVGLIDKQFDRSGVQPTTSSDNR